MKKSTERAADHQDKARFWHIAAGYYLADYRRCLHHGYDKHALSVLRNWRKAVEARAERTSLSLAEMGVTENDQIYS